MSEFKASLQGPVTDTEPDFLHDVPMDNAVGAIMALTAEVYLLRERLATLEAELASRQVLPADAVEKHVDTPEQAAARSAGRWRHPRVAGSCRCQRRRCDDHPG